MIVEGAAYVAVGVLWWAMQIGAAILLWRWRHKPERIMQMANVVAPMMLMQPQRYARQVPSLMLVGAGVSLAILPAWWGSLTSDLEVKTFLAGYQNQPLMVVTSAGFVILLLGLLCALTTLEWRFPKFLVFPFLREDEASGQTQPKPPHDVER